MQLIGMTNDQFQGKLLSPGRERQSSVQYRTLRRDSSENSSVPEEYIYTEIVKSIGNNEFIEEKHLVKRSSWSPSVSVSQEHGLPPSGKRLDMDQATVTARNLNHVRLRPKTARYCQSRTNASTSNRPISFTERYSRHLMHQNQLTLAAQALVSERLNNN